MSEKKYTQEEIRGTVDEAIRKANMMSKRELSASELDIQTIQQVKHDL